MQSIKSYKIINITFLALIFGSMMLSWFGFSRGIQEIKGITLLGNPLMLLFLLTIAVSLGLFNEKVMKIIAIIGFLGVFLLELYTYFTWHILTITGEFSLSSTIHGAYPEFYIALFMALVSALCNIIFLVRHHL